MKNNPSRMWSRQFERSYIRWNSFKCEMLPCREVSHEEFRDQFLEEDWLLYMLRAADVFILHCSQHAVLHVKVVDISFICCTLRAEGSAEGTRSVLLDQEAPVTFTGCQSFNTQTGSS